MIDFKGREEPETNTDLPFADSLITIENDDPGLRGLDVIVNRAAVQRARAQGQRGAAAQHPLAMHEGNDNVVVLIARGRPRIPAIVSIAEPPATSAADADSEAGPVWFGQRAFPVRRGARVVVFTRCSGTKPLIPARFRYSAPPPESAAAQVNRDVPCGQQLTGPRRCDAAGSSACDFMRGVSLGPACFSDNDIAQLTVSIVSHDEEFKRQVAALLRGCGVPVGIVEDRRAGADTAGPDIVVIDIRADASSGMAAIERLRAGHPTVALFAIAATAEPDLILQAMRAGANEFFPWSAGGTGRADRGVVPRRGAPNRARHAAARRGRGSRASPTCFLAPREARARPPLR